MHFYLLAHSLSPPVSLFTQYIFSATVVLTFWSDDSFGLVILKLHLYPSQTLTSSPSLPQFARQKLVSCLSARRLLSSIHQVTHRGHAQFNYPLMANQPEQLFLPSAARCTLPHDGNSRLHPCLLKLISSGRWLRCGDILVLHVCDKMNAFLSLDD